MQQVVSKSSRKAGSLVSLHWSWSDARSCIKQANEKRSVVLGSN